MVGLKSMLSQRHDRRGLEAALLLVLGFLVCLAFLHSPGTGDRLEWLRYMKLAREHGIFAAYPVAVQSLDVDYPPLSFVLLGLFARVADIFSISDFVALKISLIFLTLASAAVAGFLQKSWQSSIAVAMFLTLVLSAMLEVYIDVYCVIFLLLSIYCFTRGYMGAGAALFAISCLVKWQPIILTPLIFLHIVRRRPTWSDLAHLVPAIGVGLIVLLVYRHWVLEAFVNGFNNPKLSGQGMNLNWLFSGFMEAHVPTPDGLVFTIIRNGFFFCPAASSQYARPCALDLSFFAEHLRCVTIRLLRGFALLFLFIGP